MFGGLGGLARSGFGVGWEGVGVWEQRHGTTANKCDRTARHGKKQHDTRPTRCGTGREETERHDKRQGKTAHTSRLRTPAHDLARRPTPIRHDLYVCMCAYENVYICVCLYLQNKQNEQNNCRKQTKVKEEIKSNKSNKINQTDKP